MNTKYTFSAKVWVYPNEFASWHFVTIPRKQSEEIKKVRPYKKGFGSVPVCVGVGKTKWDTSIFPSKEGVYILPLKSKIREMESIREHDTVRVTISLKR